MTVSKILTYGKRNIKIFLSLFLYVVGILSVIRFFTLRNKVVVLMYHRVMPDDETAHSFSNPAIIVSDRVFEKHIHYLKKHFKSLSIQEFCNHIESGMPFKGYNCLITFDDGWQDNYYHAAPILERHSTPAVIFLPTDYIGSDTTFWQEKLSYLLFQLILQGDPNAPINQKYSLNTLYITDRSLLKERVIQYVNALKNSTYEEIAEIAQDVSVYLRLVSQRDSHAVIDSHMNWNQVKELMAKNISFGSHAISHRMLTSLPVEEMKQELADSQSILALHLGEEIDSIAYPNGNFNDTIASSAKEQNYSAAFTTMSGYFSNGDNPQQIRRISIHNYATSTIPLFLCRVLRIF